MKTLEQLKNYKSGPSCGISDGRDAYRLLRFFKPSEWEARGFMPQEGITDETYVVTPYTKEKVMELMAGDLKFAFDKAINRRGISSSLMFEVMKMWMWVLDDEELANFEDYDSYGMPLYQAIAKKYNLPIPKE